MLHTGDARLVRDRSVTIRQIEYMITDAIKAGTFTSIDDLRLNNRPLRLDVGAIIDAVQNAIHYFFETALATESEADQRIVESASLMMPIITLSDGRQLHRTAYDIRVICDKARHLFIKMTSLTPHLSDTMLNRPKVYVPPPPPPSRQATTQRQSRLAITATSQTPNDVNNDDGPQEQTSNGDKKRSATTDVDEMPNAKRRQQDKDKPASADKKKKKDKTPPVVTKDIRNFFAKK